MWYMKLKRNHIQSWEDLADAFAKQYDYNLDMAPDSDQLMSMSQKDSESFREYAQRWKELASQVNPPLLEKELAKMFLRTLSDRYYVRMVGVVPLEFSKIVEVRINIENAFKC